MAFLDKLLQRIERVDIKRIESIVKALAKERDLLEKVFNLLAEGIVVTDQERRISFINRAAERILTTARPVLEGEDMIGVILDPQLRELIRKAFIENKGFLGWEITLEKPLKAQVSVNVVLLKDEAGANDGAIVMLRDITAERIQQARFALVKRMKALATLAAGIAHEVGNPLNSLGIHLQLLERKIRHRKLKGKSELLELLGVANEEVQRLEHIVNQFLRAIRPERPKLREGNIITVLDRTLDFMEPEIEREGIVLRRNYDSALPPVLLDPDGLRQVFINLIENAIQAMGEGGILRVEAEYDAGKVNVSIIDNGRGISEDHLDRIFEPYFTTRGDGAGLGLMIVERIVNEHNGDLDISSMAGKGTTVTVRRPVPRKYRKLLPERKPDRRQVKQATSAAKG